jgi:hypothetical protein
MAVKDETQAFENIQEIIAFLSEKLTDARYKLRIRSEEVNQLNSLIKSVDQRLTQLNLLAAGWPKETPPAPDTSASTPDDSLRAVVDILSAHGGPMRIKSIAKYASENNLIRSTGGPDGIASIISNLLSRHSPRVFVNTGWGWWDLAEAFKEIIKKPRGAEPPPPPSNVVELNRKSS